VAVDWSIEWFTSTVWILGVTVAAGLACWLIVWLLARSTAWGRQFARLAFPYFSPRGPQGWRPLVVLLYYVNYKAFGLWPPPYHATAIALHALNGWLLCVLVTKLSGRRATGLDAR